MTNLMKQSNKWLRWSLVLSLGLGVIASCAKDDILEPAKGAQVQTQSDGQDIVETTLDLGVSVDLDQGSAEELRLLTGVWRQRSGRDALEVYPEFRLYNTVADLGSSLSDFQKAYFKVSTPNQVTQEMLDNAPYYISSNYLGGNLHSATFILYNPTIGETSVAVSKDAHMVARRDGSRQYFMYSGNITFVRKGGVQAKQETLMNTKEGWKVMVMMNTRLSQQSQDPNAIWEMVMGYPLGWNGNSNTSGDVTFTNGYHDGAGRGLPTFQAIPMASNWVDLRVNEGKNGGNTVPMLAPGQEVPEHPSAGNFKIKMQGALVQYDLVANVSDQVDIRRWGLISNSFDTQGYYVIGPKTVKEAFDQKDNEGYAVPGWTTYDRPYSSSASDPQSYIFYRRSGKFAGQYGDDRVPFPYDLPALVTPYTSHSAHVDRLLGSGQIEVAPVMDATYAFRSYAPANTGSVRTESFNPDKVLTTPKVGNAYSGVLISGTLRSPFGDRSNFHRFVMWGMPRKTKPAQPATYFFADVHNGRFPYMGASFDFGSFMKQDNPAAQPSLVLHQTSGVFKEGRINHVQTTLEADLMITEVAVMRRYNGAPVPDYTAGGKTFPGHHTAIEIINLGARNAELKDYALVALRYSKDTGRVVYVTADGGETSDLLQAHYISLGAALGEGKTKDTNGNAGTALATAWGKVYPYSGGSDGLIRNGSTSQGVRSLAYQQSALFFGGQYSDGVWTYRNTHPFNKTADEYTGVGLGQGNPFQATVRRLADHNLVNPETNDGYALVRIFPSGALRVIDSTLPIPGNTVGWNASGIGAAQLTDMSLLTARRTGSYTIERRPGINFPAIFPFRTDLNYDQQWEVTDYTDDDMKTNKVLSKGSIGYRHSSELLLETQIGITKSYGTTRYPKSGVGISAFSNYSRTPGADATWFPGYYSRIPEQTKPKM